MKLQERLTINKLNKDDVFQKISFPDKEDLDTVLSSLIKYADLYGESSVADYLDIIGLEPGFTHSLIGWTYNTLLEVRIISEGDSYYLDLPRPVSLECSL